MEPIQSIFAPVFATLNHKFPWLITLMGCARLAMKWLSGPLQAKFTWMIAEAATSPDAEEERDWEFVLRNRAYRIINFFLDLVFSFKLPVLADFLRAKAQGQQQQIETTKETPQRGVPTKI